MVGISVSHLNPPIEEIRSLPTSYDLANGLKSICPFPTFRPIPRPGHSLWSLASYELSVVLHDRKRSEERICSGRH